MRTKKFRTQKVDYDDGNVEIRTFFLNFNVLDSWCEKFRAEVMLRIYL